MMGKEIAATREKFRNFVESKNFDMFIMSLICLDAIVLGLMTSDYFKEFFGTVLFILDRLCMAIFIVEMLMKLYVYRHKFFTSNWNTFDFVVIAVSTFSFASYFIVLRTFRLFRLLKYIDRFSKLRRILSMLNALLPNFMAAMLVFAILIYVFAIMGVSLYGNVFVEFSTLGYSLFALLQVFTLDGWAENIARPVMAVFPHSWMFFMAFLLLSFLLMVSFVMSVIDEIVHRELLKEIVLECRPATKERTLPAVKKEVKIKKKTTVSRRKKTVKK